MRVAGTHPATLFSSLLPSVLAHTCCSHSSLSPSLPSWHKHGIPGISCHPCCSLCQAVPLPYLLNEEGDGWGGGCSWLTSFSLLEPRAGCCSCHSAILCGQLGESSTELQHVLGHCPGKTSPMLVWGLQVLSSVQCLDRQCHPPGDPGPRKRPKWDQPGHVNRELGTSPGPLPWHRLGMRHCGQQRAAKGAWGQI